MTKTAMMYKSTNSMYKKIIELIFQEGYNCGNVLPDTLSFFDKEGLEVARISGLKEYKKRVTLFSDPVKWNMQIRLLTLQDSKEAIQIKRECGLE